MKDHNWSQPVITHRPVTRLTADGKVGEALLKALDKKGITSNSVRGVADAIKQVAA